jgi:ADP-heptose:LPS heptosyltransferase
VKRKSPRILVIRRDNIGDLVCTTPLFRALRRQVPEAHLAALVTSYSAAVLDANPDLDAVYTYTKAKHRAPGTSVAGVYWRRLRLLAALRRERFDWALLPGGAQASALRAARWIHAAHTLVRGAPDAVAGPHEVEQSCHLLARMGLRHETPALRLAVDAREAARLEEEMRSAWGNHPAHIVGLHLSARKLAQRWPAERFAEAARRLHERHAAHVILLWSPGAADDPMHPGDDDKAEAVRAAASRVPMLAIRTQGLHTLVAALDRCDRVICSDGGAMHLAAALGKPIVCLFGNSPPERWHPWGVPHQLLQPASRDVKDVPVEEVLAAYERLS